MESWNENELIWNIVGNKSDLNIEVCDEVALKLAFRFDAFYVGVSAKTGQNVDLMFCILTREVLKRIMDMQKSFLLT